MWNLAPELWGLVVGGVGAGVSCANRGRRGPFLGRVAFLGAISQTTLLPGPPRCPVFAPLLPGRRPHLPFAFPRSINSV